MTEQNAALFFVDNDDEDVDDKKSNNSIQDLKNETWKKRHFQAKTTKL